MTTFVAIAEYSKLSFEDLDISVTSKLGKEDGRFVVSEIVLKADLIITDEKLTDKAKRIMGKAEEACLITRSIKSQIVFEPVVTVAALN